MIWLDGVFAVPVIGIRLKPNFREFTAYENCFYLFVDYLHERKEYDLAITETPNSFGHSVLLKKSGFTFQINLTNIVVGFTYEIGEEKHPGGLPSFVVPGLKTYTEVIKNILDYLEIILNLTKDLKKFKYDRIGIVADANLNKESFPPGLNKWISHLGKPWEEQLVKTEALVLAKLLEEETYFDQCHHHLKFNEENQESGFELKLDWQRNFKEPPPLDSKKTLEQVVSCKDAAIEYFGRFGEGNLNYG